MKSLWKFIAKVAFYAIALGLMGYAAMRTLHFIQATLPADQQVLGYLALLATSGGVIAWLLVFLHAAEGVAQKATAIIMVLVDVTGEFAIFAFDTLLVTGEAGMIEAMTAGEIQTVVIGMSGLIAANILATIVYHLVDPGNMRAMKEGFVKDKLEDEAMKLIEKKGEEIARDMAPRLAEEWADEFQERFKSIRALGIGSTMRDIDKSKPASLPAPAPQHQPQHQLFDNWDDGDYMDEPEFASVGEHAAPPAPAKSLSPNGHMPQEKGETAGPDFS
jgi:hypothetical protein